LAAEGQNPKRRDYKRMPKAQISIDVSGRKDLVDALDWQTIFSETLATLNNLTRAIGLARNVRRRRRSGRWKISEASTNSPLHLTLSEESADVDDASHEAVRAYIEGIRALETDEPPTEPPAFFENKTLSSVQRLVSVLRRDTAALVFSSPDIAPVSATQRVAISVDELIGAKFKATGALEGILETLTARGKINFKLYDPLTNCRIACYISPEKLEEAKAAFPHRVAVYGPIRYAKSGRPLSIEVEQIRRLRLRSELPQLKDLGRIDLTGGADSSEHIRRLRDVE
jgi:hypothetical protein